jgi:hypothetical protein
LKSKAVKIEINMAITPKLRELDVRLEELHQKAVLEFAELTKATAKDAPIIAALMKHIDERGDFYYDKENFLYDLYNPIYTKARIGKPNTDISLVKNNGQISAFVDWSVGPDSNLGPDENIWNNYTLVVEKGKGLGRKIYAAYLRPLNADKLNFMTEFVSTPAVGKVYGIWEQFDTRPMGFLSSRYTTSQGDALSGILGGRIYEFEHPGVIYVPKFAEKYAQKLCDTNDMDCIVKGIDVEPKHSDISEYAITVDFNDIEKVRDLTERGYALVGMIPNGGLVFSTIDRQGMQNLETEVSKASSTKLREVLGAFIDYAGDVGMLIMNEQH